GYSLKGRSKFLQLLAIDVLQTSKPCRPEFFAHFLPRSETDICDFIIETQTGPTHGQCRLHVGPYLWNIDLASRRRIGQIPNRRIQMRRRTSCGDGVPGAAASRTDRRLQGTGHAALVPEQRTLLVPE